MNKRVIKLGALALLAAIVLMASFAFALRGHSSGQQNTNHSGTLKANSVNANNSNNPNEAR